MIQSFNCGNTERKNKPSGLKIDDNSKYLGLNVTSHCVFSAIPHLSLLMWSKGTLIIGTLWSYRYRLLI